MRIVRNGCSHREANLSFLAGLSSICHRVCSAIELVKEGKLCYQIAFRLFLAFKVFSGDRAETK